MCPYGGKMLLLLAACRGTDPEAPTFAPVTRSYRRAAITPTAVVDCNGAGDFLTIQEAIDAASDGDAIEVYACKYDELVDFRGKTLRVFSTEGPEETTIDADGAGSAVVFRNGESVGTALVGFTIEDGDDPAIDILMSAVRLEDLVFEDSTGDRTIDSESGNLELVRVVLDDSNESNDAAIRVSSSVGTATGSTTSTVASSWTAPPSSVPAPSRSRTNTRSASSSGRCSGAR
jgi:pectin methylesterase-like acyl-CoA thioesterase